METISAEDVGIGVDLSPALSPLTFSLYDSFLSSHCSSCFSLLPPTPPHSLYCSPSCSLTDSSPTVFPPDLSPVLSTSDIRAALRLLDSISISSSSASLPHRFEGLLTNHHRLMADSSFSVAIQRAASFISGVLRSDDRENTVLEEAAICSVLTNAVEVHDRTGVALGIAVYDSRFSWINHSCSPNACYRFLISPPHSTTTTSSFQKTLPRITNTVKEHFSSITSTHEGTVRYGPKVIVRSIKRIKSGEEITVSYIDLLQPTVCFPELRCAASPPAYVDSILEGVVALEHEITTVGHHDGAATVGKMTNHIKEAIDDFLSDDINPATCCEKIEGVLHHGILNSSSLRLHPSHHVALQAYITLASAYRIRSIDSETDFGRAFEMGRIGAAYSLFLAGVSHHLVSADLSFAISAANFWTRAGESLLELACKFLMESSGEYDDVVKCSKCLMLVENHREIKENFNQILKCAIADSDSSQVTWSFLTRGCPYLQKFKSSIDFSFTGTNCEREEPSVDQRVSILLLSFHCLLFADLLTDLCYGQKSHSVS
ncbi:hypothetical protein Bca101_019163 [Brassica carinata]